MDLFGHHRYHSGRHLAILFSPSPSLSKTYTASSGFSTNLIGHLPTIWTDRFYCAGSSPVHENIIVDLVIRALTRTSQIFFNASKVDLACQFDFNVRPRVYLNSFSFKSDFFFTLVKKSPFGLSIWFQRLGQG